MSGFAVNGGTWSVSKRQTAIMTHRGLLWPFCALVIHRSTTKHPEAWWLRTIAIIYLAHLCPQWREGTAVREGAWKDCLMMGSSENSSLACLMVDAGC